jgi:type I restriction enzyme M protein
MNSNAQALVEKIWNLCDVLRDAGVSYSDYLEQLTYLLFLKMADEYNNHSDPKLRKDIAIPSEYNWQSLKNKTGDELEIHYSYVLKELGNKSGMIKNIFQKAQNKIYDSNLLNRLITLINNQTWSSMGADVKGDIYEGLLRKNAEDVKSGAGQYFTPRPVIQAIVECISPEPMKSIADPACGTGGFLLAAHEYLTKLSLSTKEKDYLKKQTFYGWEIVPTTARMCTMNLVLHDIGDLDAEPTIYREDSLLTKPIKTHDYILSNPPFGKKSSITFNNDDKDTDKESQSYNRFDFFVTTGNKQLNFIQHILSMMKVGGKAAVVLPDNVLFEAGIGEIVRKRLMQDADLHTILRLPTGIFYANGVKANVLFFDYKGTTDIVSTKEVWYYDLRTNQRFTLKERPLKLADLTDFIQCYNTKNRLVRQETWHEIENPQGQWRKFSYNDITSRDKTNMDIFWVKDESLNDLSLLPPPKELADDIISSMRSALENFEEILSELN